MSIHHIIRRLESDEAELHRDIRLRALQESPDSFGEQHVDVAARPMSYWEDLTRKVTEPDGNVMFLTVVDGVVVGSTYGLLDRDREDGGRVGGMWVDPVWRQRGLGRVLLRAVTDWAKERGFRQLGLWVPEHRPEAISLYRSEGFTDTGKRRPLPGHPNLRIMAMEREL